MFKVSFKKPNDYNIYRYPGLILEGMNVWKINQSKFSKVSV